MLTTLVEILKPAIYGQVNEVPEYRLLHVPENTRTEKKNYMGYHLRNTKKSPNT